jgi:hypothetical protein
VVIVVAVTAATVVAVTVVIVVAVTAATVDAIGAVAPIVTDAASRPGTIRRVAATPSVGRHLPSTTPSTT